MQRDARSPNEKLGASLGTGRDWRRRLLIHHAPVVLLSAGALVLFMSLSSFEPRPPGDIFSGTLPKEFAEGALEHTSPRSEPADTGGAQAPQQPGGHRPPQQPDEGHRPPQQQGGGQAPPQSGGEHAGDRAEGAARASGRSLLGLNVRRFTFASGYVATVLLDITLLVGPVSLLLHRRRPVSSYLARDIGTWAAAFSVVHVLYGVEVHGGLTISGFLAMLFRNGEPLTNSFGLANWTGVAATLIVLGLLAISNNYALGKLKAKNWKNLQRLNYALFTLVIVHAFFYGSLLRLDSYTLVLGLSVLAVFIGQTLGIWLWRRRYTRGSAVTA